jgi:hypothetical protein
MRLIASTTRVPLAAMLLLAPFPWQLTAAQETAPVVAQANVTDPNPATRPGAVPPSDAVKALYRERLGRSFAQRTRSMLQREYVFIGMLESGKTLLEVALAISPDDPNLWRLALDYAVTMEDGDDEDNGCITGYGGDGGGDNGAEAATTARVLRLLRLRRRRPQPPPPRPPPPPAKLQPPRL